MLRSFSTKKLAPEGYVYVCYGDAKYLHHVVASVITLRRYDNERPVALFCDDRHKELLEAQGLADLFDVVSSIAAQHASIVGFKHNTHHYMPFERNLYLDSDIVWCKDPSTLWPIFRAHGYTITGSKIADNFFGGPKHIGVVWDILLRRRQRTLKRFGLTYLSRVQSGMIFAQDHALTRKVNEMATQMLQNRHLTHFRSRMREQGRSEESCEWSLAMAMSKLNLPVVPWLQGQTSPQLDFIEAYTTYDDDFHRVDCTYYSDAFIYNLRGLRSGWLRKALMGMMAFIPGKADHMSVTPHCLHFGWVHQKTPFYEFAERTWNQLTTRLPATDSLYEVKNRLASP